MAAMLLLVQSESSALTRAAAILPRLNQHANDAVGLQLQTMAPRSFACVTAFTLTAPTRERVTMTAMQEDA